MAYNKTFWEDLPSTETPISAENLNKIEQGIYDAHENLDKIPEWVFENEKPVFDGYTKAETDALLDKKANAIISSASGETVVTTDSANATPSIELFGKSTQNTYKGQQLLDVHAYYNLYNCSLDGEYVVFEYDNSAGTTNRYGYFAPLVSELLKPSTNYLLVAEVVECSLNNAEINLISDAEPIIGQFVPKASKFTSTGTYVFNLSTKDDFSACTVMFRSPFTVMPNGKIKVKARLSVIEDTTVTANTFVYEPFVGGEASPNLNYPQDVVPKGASGSIEQTLFGRNICPKFEGTITQNGVTFDFKDGYVTVVGTKPASDVEANSGSLPLLLHLPKGKYSMYYGKEAGLSVKIVKADGRQQWKSNKFELDGDEQEVRLYSSIRRENTEVTVNETIPLHINVGEELLPYEEYKGEQVLVHQTPNGLHGQGDVADVIDYGQGKRITRFIKIPFLPTYDWRKYDTNFAVYNLNLNVNVNGATQMCNACHNFKKTGWKADVPQFAVADNYIRFVPNGFTDMTLEDFKARLEESEVYAICEMAEPIITDLTEEEKAQYNAIHMNYPNTTIVNSDSAYQKVEYVADTKCYIDKKFKELEIALANTNAQLL